MSHLLAGIDRIVVFILGAVLLVGGAWATAVGAGCPPARDLLRYYSQRSVDSYLQGPWFPVTLIIVGIVALIVGLALIIANLRRRGFNQVRSDKDAGTGAVTISTSRVADAAAQALERFDGVTRVKTRTKMDRTRPTITWVVEAKPTVDMPALIKAIEATEQDIHAAIPGVDVDTRFQVELLAVS